MADEILPLVLDLGSGLIKAGFAGDDAPGAVYPSIIGASRGPAVQCGTGCKRTYVGDEAQTKRGILSLQHPIENGIVMNWEALDTLLCHAFYNELAVAPEEHPILVSEHPLSPREDRWKMCQRMFESFNVPAYSPAVSSVLATYSVGRGLAINVDIGDGVLSVMPVHYGYTSSQCIRRVNFSGRDLTHYLTRLLIDQGCYLNRTSDFETVREMKEKLCYVALDYEEEVHRSLSSAQLKKTYELPDGQVITLDSERFTCPEALFQPSLVGREGPGVHELVFDAITSADKDIQRDLFGNIVLTGGSTMFNGFADRMHKEISRLAPANMRCKIIATPERKYSVWIGGAIIASLTSFQDKWITKTEYDEVGPNMVFKKGILAKQF